jgi:hypothetical protein
MTTKAEYEAQVAGLQAQANAYAQGYGLTGAHNGSWDAFRHAYVSAEMARVHGTFTAKILGDLYEAQGQMSGQPWNEKNMDLWNNAAGRKIGARSESPGDTAHRVKNALDNDSLIKSPNDSRNADTGQPDPNDKDPEVCCEECGAANTFPPPPRPPQPGQSEDSEDKVFVFIPPMMVPPFNTTAYGRALNADSISSDEQPEARLNNAQAEELPEPLQASVDSTMVLIAEVQFDDAIATAQYAESEHVGSSPILGWEGHREHETAII